MPKWNVTNAGHSTFALRHSENATVLALDDGMVGDCFGHVDWGATNGGRVGRVGVDCHSRRGFANDAQQGDHAVLPESGRIGMPIEGDPPRSLVELLHVDGTKVLADDKLPDVPNDLPVGHANRDVLHPPVEV